MENNESNNEYHIGKKREHNAADADSYPDNRRDNPGRYKFDQKAVGNNSRQRSDQYNKSDWKRQLKSQNGTALIELLMSLAILLFLTFGSLDYWVIMTKHQYAEHLMHKYLQRMQMEGRLSSVDENALVTEFSNFSCQVETVTGQRESQGDPRILRNTSDLNGSMVSLRVACKPTPQPLLVGRIIGGSTPGAGFRIIVGGSMLSERIRP